MIEPPLPSGRAWPVVLLFMGCGQAPSQSVGARTAGVATGRSVVRLPSDPAAGSTGAERSKARTVTVLLTSDPETAYCDGERMDSAGYRRTLTKEKELRLPPEGASDNELVRAVIDAATVGMCNTVMRQLEYRIEAGSVHIPPFDGWAGVSITMCTCQPEVEVNLVRIPGVARVVWDEQ